MAKNAVDAHRKALRQKEVKKNKQARTKAREVAVVKKDVRPLEADIKRLTSKGKLSEADQKELGGLRAELSRVMKAKTEYVEAHPEHRKFVFPDRPSSNNEGGAGESHGADPPGLYTRDGRLKHPERSLYYDPVFNPFGAPPPGMPYREKPPTPEEMAQFMAMPIGGAEEESEDSDDDDGEDDDDDIVMPDGPPPGEAADEDSDSSEDSDGIELPAGPPPPRPATMTGAQAHAHRANISRPSGGPRPHQPLPSRPFHQPFHPEAHMRAPPGAPSGPRNPHRLPPRPMPPPTHVVDPVTGEARPTYQGYQQQRHAPPPPPSTSSTSAGPTPPPASEAPPPPPPGFVPLGSAGASATISAAPVLRDLKAEATAFLPSHMRKKKAAAPPPTVAQASGLGAIDAAKGGAEGVGGERASLMGALKGVGIGGGGDGKEKKVDKGKEDYERFEREMADFL